MTAFDKIMPSSNPIPEVTLGHLTELYPNTYSDFYGSGTPYVFKSGPEWPTCTGPEAQGIVHEACPIYHHAIGLTWPSISTRIYQNLNSRGVIWTSINPLTYTNQGDAKPFCSLILSIGVRPSSLSYKNAITAAKTVKEILADAGFPDIKVAFVESVATHSGITGPKPLSFDPLIDHIPNLQKPFTTSLALSIAPLKHSHFEGTATLYYYLGTDGNCTTVLACAHVTHPPPTYSNTGKNTSESLEEVIVLGGEGYNNTIKAIVGYTNGFNESIEVWKQKIARLGGFVKREPPRVTNKCKEFLKLVVKAMDIIKEAGVLCNNVTKYYVILE